MLACQLGCGRARAVPTLDIEGSALDTEEGIDMNEHRTRIASIGLAAVVILGGTACTDGAFGGAPSVGDHAASPPASSTNQGDSSLDGVYRWTITAEDARAHGTEGDKTDEALATFPWTCTMTMTEGTWSLEVREVGEEIDVDGGTYAVNGDELIFENGADSLTLPFTFVVDHESLTLTATPQMPRGDAFVWATQPWTRID